MQIVSLPRQVTITYGSLWDGLAASVKNMGTLYIEQSVIVAKATGTHAPAQVLDFTHATLLPALIDSHVHLAFPSDDKQTLMQRAQHYLNAGVATIRDGGSTCGFLAADTRLQIRQSIAAIYKKGYYGAALGNAVGNMKETLQAVDKLAAAGATQIKVIASGIFSFTHYGQTGPATFTATELRTIVKRAHLHGLPVMVHASGDEAVQHSLQAGVTTIEHGYFMSKESIREIAASGTFWIPTLSPINNQLAQAKIVTTLPFSMQQVILRSLLRHQEFIAEGAILGAQIVAGTDAGAPGVSHGASLPQEIMLLHNAGLSSLTALQAATSVAASACHLPTLGTIEPGQRPCLLVVQGNPLTNPGVLLAPEALLLPSYDADDL
ncbi:MAG: amidohydrolase family protein [Firmicutes bacterium]|nr:amidohydrolase family protein [Bacillota bacterium]